MIGSVQRQVLSTRTSAPNYTLGPRWADQPGLEELPGPSHYKSDAADGVGAAAVRSDRPSPGSVVFGAAPPKHADPEAKAPRPGPGAYEAPPVVGPKAVLSTVRSAPSFSLGGRERLANESADTVGPGVCREDTAFSERPRTGARFGTEERASPIKTGDGNPGPGSYEQRPLRDGPSFSLSGRPRDKSDPDGSAGPAQCRTDSPFNAHPMEHRRRGFKFAGRHPMPADRSSSPGPGAYDAPMPRPSRRRRKGKKRRPRRVGDEPSTFGQRVPIAGHQPPDTPAPDAYRPRLSKSSLFKNPGRTKLGAPPPKPSEAAQKSRRAAPGPGEYEIPPALGRQAVSTIRSSPGVPVAGREAFGSLTFGDTAGPGPGQRLPDKDPTRPSFGGARFGTAPRRPGASFGQGPGPGAYEAPPMVSGKSSLSRVRTAPSFSLSGKPKGRLSSIRRAPQYHKARSGMGKQVASHKKSAASFSFGGRFSTGRRLENTPGPGAYG